MQGAIVYRWGQTVPGREQLALELFQASGEMFDGFAKNNQIMGHYPYLSMNRDGGMWLIHGETDQLMALQALPEVQMIQARVQAAVTDWSAEWLIGGSPEELSGAMEMFGQLAAELD
jgi:hypothetical protein